jgi:hypothetical protein
LAVPVVWGFDQIASTVRCRSQFSANGSTSTTIRLNQLDWLLVRCRMLIVDSHGAQAGASLTAKSLKVVSAVRSRRQAALGNGLPPDLLEQSNENERA